MQKISMGLIIALAATGIFLSLVTAGIIATQTIPSIGTVSAVNVGVYSNSGCTQNVTSVSWGAVYPGNTTTRLIYVKNTGTLPVTLNMATESWLPTTASSALTLTWNRQNTRLNAGESIPATLTLTVSSSPGSVTDFSFNIIITGSE